MSCEDENPSIFTNDKEFNKIKETMNIVFPRFKLIEEFSDFIDMCGDLYIAGKYLRYSQRNDAPLSIFNEEIKSLYRLIIAEYESIVRVSISNILEVQVGKFYLSR